MSCTHLADVRAKLGSMRTAPHNNSNLSSSPVTSMLSVQGNRPGVASLPPTMWCDVAVPARKDAPDLGVPHTYSSWHAPRAVKAPREKR